MSALLGSSSDELEARPGPSLQERLRSDRCGPVLSAKGRRQLLQLLMALLRPLPSAPFVATVTSTCEAQVSLVLFCPHLA